MTNSTSGNLITQESKLLGSAIDLLIDVASRKNTAKRTRYWYPLAQATYGREEVIEALDSMCSFRTSMWEKTARFESLLADYLGGGSTIMVNSGSSADLLLCYLLRELVNPRGEDLPTMIVPAVTWPTQLWSPLMAGFPVKMVDVDPLTNNICMSSLEQLLGSISGKKILFLVHILGNPVDMNILMPLLHEYDTELIEDNCESLGSRYDGRMTGTFGIGSAMSFFFSHHMMTMEGGAVFLDNDTHLSIAKELRAHGWVRDSSLTASKDSAVLGFEDRYRFARWGFNIRPTEVSAAFGIHQVQKLDYYSERRKRLYAQFAKGIEGLGWVVTPNVSRKADPNWMAIPLRVEGKFCTRQSLVAYLENRGVETRPLVAGNLTRQEAVQRYIDVDADSYCGADIVHNNSFYIGLSPFNTENDIERLVNVFRTYNA